MYAVIATGGKQARVEEGQRLDVEVLAAKGDGTVALRPVLIVDGDRTLATADQLGDAVVEARVVGESKGPKIKAMTYQAKARRRRRWGHRQKYTTIEITRIRTGSDGAAEPETDAALEPVAPGPPAATAGD